MLDDKLARIKRLIAKREQVDAELSQLLGIAEKAKRSRQSNDEANGAVDTTTTTEGSTSHPA